MKRFVLILFLHSVFNNDDAIAQIYVDQSANGNNDGSSWADAFTDIQSAVNVAMDNDEILIAEGLYQQGTEILINKPLIIRGGYDANNGSQNMTANPTIIDGNNSHRVLNISAETVLIGLTIQHGRVYSEVAGGVSETSGGGILATEKLTGVQLIIKNNSAESNSIGNTFVNATSFTYGGGVKGTTVILTNSQVIGNSASAFASTQTSPNSTSSANATATGGGIEANSTQLINSQIINNLTFAFTTPSSSPEEPESYGGGVYGSLELGNGILWNNFAETDGIVVTTNASEHEGGTLTTNHSLIKNQNPAGAGNIDATVMGFDPLFVDEVGGNFRLQEGSPLNDSGDFNLLPFDDYDIDGDGDFMELFPLDLDGYARDVGFNVDIGPYEFGDLIFRNGF